MVLVKHSGQRGVLLSYERDAPDDDGLYTVQLDGLKAEEIKVKAEDIVTETVKTDLSA